jgi:zinc-ribbon domain
MYNAIQAAGLAAALGIAVPGFLAHPGWVAPGYGYPQSIHVSVQTDAAAGETTLTACGNCGQTNPAGARFCTGCGTRLG